MVEWAIELLEKGSFDRNDFCCGVESLDTYLRTLAGQYERRHLGRTYVAVRPGENRVLGYYTLTAGSVSFESLPVASSKRLPRHPVPVILLSRLAVDRQVHGQGLGGFLLLDAFHRCLDFSTALGVHAVEAQAIDEKAKSFYEKYGFSALTDDPRHLFITIAQLAKADSGSSHTGA